MVKPDSLQLMLLPATLWSSWFSRDWHVMNEETAAKAFSPKVPLPPRQPAFLTTRFSAARVPRPLLSFPGWLPARGSLRHGRRGRRTGGV